MSKINYFKKERSKFDILSDNGKIRFPVEIFPEDLQFIIKSLYKYAGFEKQVTSSAILFVVSTLIGNGKKIHVKGTWIDTPNLWLAVVGRRGTMKTHAINFCLKPLSEDEKMFAKQFNDELEEYYKQKKEDREESKRPRRRQRFSNDTTVEGLIHAMEYNANGMGIFKDELNGFFEEMNRYKSGGNLEFYLSAFNGGSYVKNRKSYDPQTINNIFLSMLGSIQPEVLRAIAASQISNGMI